MLILVFLSLIIWIYLILGRGYFWRCNQFLDEQNLTHQKIKITAIIPARNEAENILICLK